MMPIPCEINVIEWNSIFVFILKKIPPYVTKGVAVCPADTRKTYRLRHGRAYSMDYDNSPFTDQKTIKWPEDFLPRETGTMATMDTHHCRMIESVASSRSVKCWCGGSIGRYTSSTLTAAIFVISTLCQMQQRAATRSISEADIHRGNGMPSHFITIRRLLAQPFDRSVDQRHDRYSNCN